MDNTILLIDGSSFIFRAFYAVKNLTAPNGMPTNAIYGIINMLKQMQKKHLTQHWVCVFDAKGKTFRDDIYPEYKANRRATPEELIVQFSYIHEIVADLGIPVIIQEGVEADDVIATIAKKYAAQGHQILIATGDKDFAQIVTPQITLINTMTNEVLDTYGVESKFGVKPEQIIDYLSLIGDNVDNVPGVTKCGPKTAQKWLTEFGSIDNLIKNQAQLTGVVGENFRATVEWLPTAQKLITIDCAVKISNLDIDNLANLRVKAADWPKLAKVFRELNFRTWLREAEQYCQATTADHTTHEVSPAIEASVPLSNLVQSDLFGENTPNTPVGDNSPVPALASIVRIKTPAELQIAINQLAVSKAASAFNIIQENYSDLQSPISMVTISSPQHSYLINLNHGKQNELRFEEDENSQQMLTLLKAYWESSAAKICHNYKQVLYILDYLQINLAGISGDLQLASYLQNSLQDHSLSAILERVLPNSTLSTPAELLGKGAKRIDFAAISSDQQEAWVLAHAELMLSAHHILLASLSKKEHQLYLDVELPLARLLFDLEREGMLIDIVKLKQLAQVMHLQLQQLEEKIQHAAGCAFNLNSPKQLQDILFQQLKYPTAGIKKNTGGYSTNEESLTLLSEAGYALADQLLEYRYLNKLLSTYIDRLPEFADRNNLVHTSLEQTVVTSGRLSSRDPNLQNIPIRSTYGQAIRECFIAKPGHQLVCADYSQIELRILAHISQDANLIAAFHSNADIHSATASQIFNKPLEEVSKEERRYAKSINFGLIYGKSVFGLAKELKINRAAAKLYIDNYFAQYPRVKDFMENIKELAHQQGYVETIYGRKIYLANINAGNNILRQAEERLALNAPMQGSAADIIKIAMLNVNGWLAANQLKTKMVLQVHDELIFQVPNDEIDLILQNLSRLMGEMCKLAVPLKVDIKAELNWAAAH